MVIITLLTWLFILNNSFIFPTAKLPTDIINTVSELTKKTINTNSLTELKSLVRAKAVDLVPTLARPALSLIPPKLQNYVLLSFLSSAFNEAITDGDFIFLESRWLAIEIPDLALNWRLSFDGEKLIMPDRTVENNGKADVTFTANGDDLLLIAARKQDPDTLFFQRRLVITGDTELGLEIKNIIDSLDTDQLPKCINALVNTLASFLDAEQIQV